MSSPEFPQLKKEVPNLQRVTQVIDRFARTNWLRFTLMATILAGGITTDTHPTFAQDPGQWMWDQAAGHYVWTQDFGSDGSNSNWNLPGQWQPDGNGSFNRIPLPINNLPSQETNTPVSPTIPVFCQNPVFELGAAFVFGDKYTEYACNPPAVHQAPITNPRDFTMPAEFNPWVYNRTVWPGETLADLAQMYGFTEQQLLDYNQGRMPIEGQAYWIPWGK